MAAEIDTVFVRGQGGTIFEMDVPEFGHAKERFDQALAKGELALVAAAEWVERGDGSKYLVEVVESEPAQSTPNDVPPAQWKKAELVGWLTSNEVDHDPKATNAVLAEIVVGAREWFDAVEAAEQGQA